MIHDFSLARSENQKRERQLNPEIRWNLIQQAIVWADAQRPVSRATPAACKANEARILDFFERKRAMRQNRP